MFGLAHCLHRHHCHGTLISCPRPIPPSLLALFRVPSLLSVTPYFEIRPANISNLWTADMVSTASRLPPWASLFFVSLLLVTHLPTACLAQASTGSSSGSPTVSSTTTSQSSSTSSAAPQTHTIQVGLADHKFKPETTNANIGDVSTISLP
jgi:hypothetical protein